MQIRVLGCHGSQTPGCNTTSFLLNGNTLVDAGTITSLLTIEEQLKINHVLITHAHLDHVRDIMFLADNICYLQKERPLLLSLPRPLLIHLKPIFSTISCGRIFPGFPIPKIRS